MSKLKIILISATTLSTLLAQAMDSVDVLPKGIASPAIRQGFISGIDQKFTGSGSLITLSDANSIELNLSTIKSIEPEVAQLESALNKFGQNNLGSEIHLGTLRVEVEPRVQYFAPIFAVGVTDKWTLGFGAPVVTYQNKLGFSQQGSNIPQLKEQFYGVASPIDEAFDQLDQDMSAAAQTHLINLGYKPIQDRNETFLGDVQLVSLYQINKSDSWGTLWMSGLTLPTGPKDDPDDLTDLNAFGQTSLDNQLIGNYFMNRFVTLSTKVGYKWAVADQIDKRVPTDANDNLPSLNRKSKVFRDIGDSSLVGGSITLNMTKTVSILAGIEQTKKQSDSYRGSLDGDYTLLERDTASSASKSKYGFTYSTVKKYFDKESIIPAMFTFLYSDTFSGVNSERQTLTELSATMFF